MKRQILIILFTIILLIPIAAKAAMIDNIENSLYGFTYNSQDETTRLNRIEETVYGKKSNKTNAQKIAKLKKDLSADLIGQEIPPKEDTFMEDSDYEKTVVDNNIPQGSNIDYPIINEMEKKVFNKEFKTNDVNGRLAKLEQKAFGKTYNDDLNTRVERLQSKLLPQANSIAQSDDNYYDDDDFSANTAQNFPKNYTLPQYGNPDDFDYDSFNSRNYQSPNQYGKSSSTRTVNLTAVENAMFKQSYTSDPIENRLARIEAGMFGTTFDNDSQTERLERIGSAFKAQKSAKKYDSNKFSQNMTTAIQIGTIIL